MHIYHPNIYCHTGNFCCVVVIISHVMIFRTNNQIGIITMHILQYMSYLSLNCMVYSACKMPTRWKETNCLYFQDQTNVTPAKIYTIKELVIMETSIAYFHTSLYIPEIQKLAFHLPCVCILGNNNCGNTCREAFKCCSAKQDVLCRHGYVERVVASFAHQIQYEYYGGNIYVSI